MMPMGTPYGMYLVLWTFFFLFHVSTSLGLSYRSHAQIKKEREEEEEIYWRINSKDLSAAGLPQLTHIILASPCKQQQSGD